MNTISYYLGVSKQTEVLLLVLAGICCTIFDASLFNLHTNLYKVWNMPMDPTKFTDTAQLYVKYVLSSIVLVRTFTVHLYLAFYIVMLWPAIFEEKPGLLIPWLTVGAVKCLATGAMSFSTGLYICLTYRFSKAACWDFMMTQMIDQGPSIYMWFCILSYYYDLKRDALNILCDRQTPSTAFGLAERRRRVRSLIPGTKLHHTFDDERQLISASTIDTLVNQLNTNLRNQTSRSLDSLLCKIAAEAEKEEILGTKEEPLEDEKGLSFADKTLRTLNISPSYVIDAKKRKDLLSPTHTEGKGLKAESTPLPVIRSPGDLQLKTTDARLKPAHSDEISVILSETELHSTNIIEDTQNPHHNTPRSSFKGEDLAIELEKLFEKKNDEENTELTGIIIRNFDDDISEYSKTCCFLNDSYDNELDKSQSKEKGVVENVACLSIEKPAVEFLAQKTSCKANCRKIENDLPKSISREDESTKTGGLIRRPAVECLKDETSCKANSMKIEYGLVKNISKDNESPKTDQSVERPGIGISCKANCRKIENDLAKNTFKDNENAKTCHSIERPAVVRLAQKTSCKANSMKIDYVTENLSRENENTSNICRANIKRSVPNVIENLPQKTSGCPKTDVTKEKISNRCGINDIHKETKIAEDTYLTENCTESPVVESLTQKEIPVFPKPEIEMMSANNENILEREVNDKMLSISKASVNVTQPPPATLKSKSQDTNKSHLTLSTFKYDGYTLAYIESQRRRAAVEIIKNRKRPSSSGA